jgi:hypothetical protein
LIYGFNFDPIIISNIGCQIYDFFNYALDALSPWCLVYISVEKFISIAYPGKRLIFKKERNQIIFFIILCLFNFIYHLNIPFSVEIETINNLTLCFFNSYENQIIISNMDLFNYILIPFFLMILFSFLLIRSIFKARRRVDINNSDREHKRLRQDIKVSLSLLLMNLIFILLNLPLTIGLLLPTSYYNLDLYVLLSYIFNISSAINFYLILLTNSLFRQEFYSLFKIIKKNNNQQIHVIEIQTFSKRQAENGTDRKNATTNF